MGIDNGNQIIFKMTGVVANELNLMLNYCLIFILIVLLVTLPGVYWTTVWKYIGMNWYLCIVLKNMENN